MTATSAQSAFNANPFPDLPAWAQPLASLIARRASVSTEREWG